VQPPRDAVQRLTVRRSVLEQHFLRTVETSYTFENRGATAREVCLVLHVGRYTRVTGADAVDFDTASATPMAVVRVGPRASIDRTITTVEGLDATQPLNKVRTDDLAPLVASPDLPAAEKAIAAEALARQRQLEDTRSAKEHVAAQVVASDKELERLREDMKALGGERGGAAPAEFVKRLLAAEERRAALHAEDERLAAEEDARARAVGETLARLPP